MRKRQIYKSDRQLERQTNILHMARRLAGRVGYDGLTMRELADLAEVSSKTLYNLFNSKDDLLVAALEDLIGIIRRSVKDHTHLNGFDYILAIRRTGSESMARSPGFANVIVSLFFRARPHDRIVESLVGGPRNEIVRNIEYERSRGQMHHPVDPRTLALHLLAQSWTTLLAWDKGLLSLDEIVPSEQLSYITTLMGISSDARRAKLRKHLGKVNYKPSLKKETATNSTPEDGSDSARRIYRSPRQMQRRAEILKAVREAIKNHGYHGMTMRALADQAGVSPKTLYNIYGSKDALLLAAVTDLLTSIKPATPEDDGSSMFDAMLRGRDAASRETLQNSQYAHAITQALLEAKPGEKLVEVLLATPAQRIYLQLMEEPSSVFVKDLDLKAVAQMLAFQDWGILMLWCKGVLELDEAIVERRRSVLMTLAGVTTGRTRETFVAGLREMEPALSAVAD